MRPLRRRGAGSEARHARQRAWRSSRPTRSRDALGARGIEAEIVEITTSGDRGVAGDKARWIDTIEDALERGDIDLAVHSAKDVPAASLLRPGMRLAAVLGREDARDALVGAESLDALPEGARVGTASLRRRAQLLARARGPARSSSCAATSTRACASCATGSATRSSWPPRACGGWGWSARSARLLDPAVFVPAPGQGALAVEGREIPDVLVDAAADAALRAERAVRRSAGGDLRHAGRRPS